MTRLTFGVSASLFATNVALRQNVLNYSESHPQAARVALKSFYMDDSLTGADSICEAIQLQRELQDLLWLGAFTLRK